MTSMTVSGHTYDLDPQRVEKALRGELPEPIYEHFVVINGRRWPPKQVLSLVTGLDRADFTTHQARRALTRLGFTAARAAHRRNRNLAASAAAQREPASAKAEALPQSPAEALRPVVDMALEGLEAAPMGCLLDSGALRTRMSAELAPLAGIELTRALTERFYLGGVETIGSMARVNLTVSDGADEFTWDAPVWFCDPWPHAFGPAGLEGFLQLFVVTIRAYEYLDVEPNLGSPPT
jgi:hypothetical protein